MKRISKLSLFTFFLTLFSVLAFSQSEKTDQEMFLSGEGNFSLNVPANPTSSIEIPSKRLNYMGEGRRLIWTKPAEYNYVVQYIKLFPDEDDKLTDKYRQSFLESYKSGVIADIKSKNAPYRQKSYSFKGNSGYELEAVYPDSRAFIRIFFVKEKLYSVSVAISKSKDKKVAFAILDSFKLLDPKIRLAQQVKEATPKPLPQSPVAKKLKSDAEDENLKGKVKSIIEYTQDKTGKKLKSSEYFYNEQGNLIKEINYTNGYPFDVTVWGYIDSKRVSDWKTVKYDNQYATTGVFSISTVNPNPEEVAKRDLRYSNRYTYKYDELGKLAEKIMYQNNGEVWLKYVNKYNSNKRTQLIYSVNGELNQQYNYKLDADGNVIEKSTTDVRTKKIGSQSIYKYKKFDSNNNWIIRERYNKKTKNGRSVLTLRNIDMRTIEYY